jgi:uncharacterized protein (TIGR02996 family)
MKNPALLKDILANPDDDAPRLAYADWLKKNGDPDRAELIRVQCKRAQLEEDDPAGERLMKKEKSLLKKHEQRWKAELPEWAQVGVRFRRGFVGELILDVDTFVQRGGELLQITSMDSLELGQTEVTDRQLKALAECPYTACLTELKLWFNGITDKGIKALAASPYISKLRTLRLSSTYAGDEGLKALAASEHLSALTTLDIGGTNLTPAGLQALASAPWKLNRLELPNLPLGSKGMKLLAGMSSLASLSWLMLSNSKIDARAVKALVASPYLTNLRVLYLDTNPLTAAGVAALAEAPLVASLRELYLQNSGLDEECVPALVDSPHLAGLKRLVMVNNNFSREPNAGGEELVRRFGKAVAY